MHFEGVVAVLEVVAVRMRVPRELAGLADRDEPGVERQGDRRGEDEPARFDADHLGHAVRERLRSSRRVAARNAARIAEQRA